LMPLPTSYTYSFDTCDLDNEWIVNSDGSSYVLNSIKCSISEPDTFYQDTWSFSNDRKQISFEGGSTFYIESITPSKMKLYYYYAVTPSGHPPIRFVRLWTFKSI
jgi:beta-xylosidase